MANDNQQFPPQHQERHPGLREEMTPKPHTTRYQGCDKLTGRVALITGGDSGIGRAVAVAYAREGADVALCYLDEHQDAEETRQLVEQEGRKVITIAGDVGDKGFCEQAVARTLEVFGKLDILVNNASEQHVCKELTEISAEQLERTFRTNIFGMFFMAQAALPHLKEGACIINTTSITAYKGMPVLMDYASTKGAIVAFTRSLAMNLTPKGIRVNGVAPGPVWTPLIPASFGDEQVEDFGGSTPMGRAGQPDEIAPSYVFLASEDAAFMSGQVLHPNGGQVING